MHQAQCACVGSVQIQIIETILICTYCNAIDGIHIDRNSTRIHLQKLKKTLSESINQLDTYSLAFLLLSFPLLFIPLLSSPFHLLFLHPFLHQSNSPPPLFLPPFINSPENLHYNHKPHPYISPQKSLPKDPLSKLLWEKKKIMINECIQ